MGPGKEGRAAADRARARLELAEWAQRRGEPVDAPIPARWTLGVLSEKDLAVNAGRPSAASRERLWRVILEGLGEATPLHELTASRIQAWATTRAASVAARTVNNGLSLLASALRYARRMREVSGFGANPFAEVTRIPVAPDARRLALPDPEIRQLIARAWTRAKAAPRHLAGAWRDDAAIIELLYLTSSRISQVLRLRWDQVHDGAIHFPPHKRGAAREFALTGRIAKILRATPRLGEYVFPPAPRARKPYREDIKRFWREIAPDGFTPHGLRHSAITAALYAGETPGDVADRGGWKDLQMLTRTYGHVFRRRLGPTPRAGLKTAGNSGRRRRTDAGEQPQGPHTPKPPQGRQTRKTAIPVAHGGPLVPRESR